MTDSDETEREQLWFDFDQKEVHIRDKWQFALKSDFFPKSGSGSNQYVQEFYLFVPNSLQINSDTYTKTHFYHDITSLIRYKTPEFSFAQLLDKSNDLSPLAFVLKLSMARKTPESRTRLTEELKLLANVVRSSLRREIKILSEMLKQLAEGKASFIEFNKRTELLCKLIDDLKETFTEAQKKSAAHWNDASLSKEWLYIEEYISEAISHYFTILLERMRHSPPENDFGKLDQIICACILKENSLHINQTDSLMNSVQGEKSVYRLSLLNKFVLDALQLSSNRMSMDQRFQHWIGALSAGIAMLLYFTLFAWLGTVFILNSLPFIFITVVIYILKDRIKEWLKVASYQHASRWFPDYVTIIRTPDQKSDLGLLRESFSYINLNQLPEDLKKSRNVEFHTVLETFQRPESVLFYKRIVEINRAKSLPDARRIGLNIIFRFNISSFLQKASDPYETFLTLDRETKELKSVRLPKVYHLVLIIKSRLLHSDKTKTVEMQKLRIIIDKNGIKRIEQVS